MKLPNGDHAIVEIRRLLEYCLNSQHPRGRNKARVFASLGIREADAEELRSALFAAAEGSDDDAEGLGGDPHEGASADGGEGVPRWAMRRKASRPAGPWWNGMGNPKTCPHEWGHGSLKGYATTL